jgi:diguanylate cyclase (GGDEF)-like protein
MHAPDHQPSPHTERAARGSRSPRGSRLAVAAGIAAVVLCTLAVVTWNRSSNNAQLARDTRTTSAHVTMVALRSTLERTLLDEAHTRALHAVGVVGTDAIEAATRERVAIVTDSNGQLREVAASGGATADEAVNLLVGLAGLDDAATNDTFLLHRSAIYVRFGDRPAPDDDRAQAERELSNIAVIANLILEESIAGDVVENGRNVDRGEAPFIVERANEEPFRGGWLGPDATAPLQGARFIDFDAASDRYPDIVERASQSLTDHGLVAVDEWNRTIGDPEASAAPFTLEEITTNVVASSNELRSLFDEVVASEVAELDAAAVDADARRQQLLVLAALLGAAGLAAAATLLRLVVMTMRRSHHRAQLATVDSLTGLGNRLELDERTRSLTANPKFIEHVLAIIDLDRFKMINDVHGHATGDAVLIEMSRQLEACGDQLTEWCPGSQHTTIRLGGDEFLMSLHAACKLDVDGVRQHLEAIRSATIRLDDDTTLAIEFSLGIVHATGPNDLSELMRIADLAVYDNKAERAKRRAQQSTVDAEREHAAEHEHDVGREHDVGTGR